MAGRSLAGVLGLALGIALVVSTPASAFTGYVTNRGDDDVAVLDTESGVAGAKVGGDIAVGASPAPVDASPGGSSAYVVNLLGGFGGVGDISEIATATNTIVAPNIPQSEGPDDVVFAPSGEEAYVPNYTGTLEVVDTGSRTTTASVPVGPGLRAADVTSDGARVLVADDGGLVLTPEVSLFETSTDTSADANDVTVGDAGDELVAIAVAPGDAEAYVVNTTDGVVSLVDVGEPLTSSVDISVGAGPTDIAINPDGTKAYVTNSVDDDVSVIDLTSGTTGTPIALDPGSAPSAVEFTPDGARAYVTNRGNDDVTAIDAATDARIGSDIAVGDEPSGVALFAVPSSPPPPAGPPPPPAETPLPDPEVGETANVEPTRGTVTARCRGEREFTELVVATQVPIGCVIDATDGVLRLTTATGVGDETQTAKFWAGRFKVKQREAVRSSGAGEAAAKARAIPFTVLKLVGPLRRPGKSSSSAFPASDKWAETAKKKKKKKKKKKRKKRRRLWGKGKGKFKTKGRKGAGSIRGTKWLTEDRRRSTRLRVKRGKVRFRDFVEDRTVTVRKGETYVAKRRRR